MVCAQDFFGTKTFRKVHFPNAFVIFLQAVATPRIRRVSGACVAKMTAECLGSNMDAKDRKKIVQKKPTPEPEVFHKISGIPPVPVLIPIDVRQSHSTGITFGSSDFHAGLDICKDEKSHPLFGKSQG